ncbi:nuclear transport factor 2 family protein [Mycolicibacterium thermoresistibile]
MTYTRAELIAAVERSPQAAGAHDRQGWVGLFSADARIEDPVGSRPHVGRAEIEQFYDTFIEPRRITFHRDLDIVVGATVLRDLQLEVTMANHLTLQIPAYLRYDLQYDDTEISISALHAYWELPSMVGAFLRGGVRAIPAGVGLSRALMANQGLAGAAGFLLGFGGLGADSRTEFGRFLSDAASGDEVAVRRRLARGARITLGDQEPMTATNLLTRLAGTQSTKLIGAGNALVAGIERGDRREVLIAEADPRPLTINRIRYFTEHRQG